MGIDSQTEKRYVNGIIRTVTRAPKAMKVPQLLSEVQSGNASFKKEITVALLWHLLASNKLRFNEARQIVITL